MGSGDKRQRRERRLKQKRQREREWQASKSAGDVPRASPLIVVQDTTPWLRRQVSRYDLREAYGSAIVSDLTSRAGFPGCDGVRTVVSGEEAEPHLHSLRDGLEAIASEIANRHSRAAWLWYLRRLRGQFNLNRLESTERYCQALSEALSAVSTSPNPHYEVNVRPKIHLVFPVDDDAVRDIDELCSIARLLYVVHSEIRWAGKGSDIVFSAAALPRADPAEELQTAVRLVDERGGRTSYLAGAGLAANPSRRVPHSAIASTIPLAGFADSSERAPAWLGGPKAPPGCGFDLVDLGDDVVRDPNLPVELRWPVGLAELIVLHLCSYHRWFSESAGSGDVYRKFGYYLVPHSLLVNSCDAWIEELRRGGLGGLMPASVVPKSGEALLATLGAIPPRFLPPFSGSAVQSLGDFAMVDLVGASRCLMEMLRRPAEGDESVNVWSNTFELHVQRMIDATQWKPMRDLAALRGVTLRRGGTALTDIDAIGALGDTLLAVSCKSVPFRVDYDAGKFQAVRNVRTTCEEAEADWKTKMTELEDNPVGDNFDLSGYRRILGVVVLPFPPFLVSSETTRFAAPGLRVVSSANELHDWCDSADVSA
ncbi:MAG: hypothetical protein M3Q30_10150 [Actinomycetota bacterium]|nr:hypothetical protein [Actinomycetota bacterium]